MHRRLFAIAAFASLAAACGPKKAAQSTAIPGIGGPFSLVDQDGKPVTEAVLKGKWTAIYFGFTYCPDICPTSLQALKEGLDKLGAKGKSVQTILISVDPERDTPAVLKTYLDNPSFPVGIRGLTGTPEQVAAAAKAYRLYYAKQGEGPDYQVQHQSIIYLMNPEGELARPLTHDLTPDQIAAQIGDALRQGV